MKKINTFVVLILFIFFLPSCGKKNTESINLPDGSDIDVVKITQNNQTFEKVDSEWITELVKQVGTGKSTEKESVQDVPNVAEYIKIDLILNDNDIITLFIYHQKDKWYIEQPYQGIYLANDALIEIINRMD